MKVGVVEHLARCGALKDADTIAFDHGKTLTERNDARMVSWLAQSAGREELVETRFSRMCVQECERYQRKPALLWWYVRIRGQWSLDSTVSSDKHVKRVMNSDPHLLVCFCLAMWTLSYALSETPKRIQNHGRNGHEGRLSLLD